VVLCIPWCGIGVLWSGWSWIPCITVSGSCPHSRDAQSGLVEAGKSAEWGDGEDTRSYATTGLTCAKRSIPRGVNDFVLISELDALGLDDEPIGEGEVPSYLQDSQALPDFVDTAPLEDQQVGRVILFSLARKTLSRRGNVAVQDPFPLPIFYLFHLLL
jgi:hypothetical protein